MPREQSGSQLPTTSPQSNNIGENDHLFGLAGFKLFT